MRICYLADYRSIHTMRWIRYFSEEHHDVHLISLNFSETEKRPFVPSDYEKIGIKVHLLDRTGFGKYMAPSRARRLIAHIEPDLIHCHYVSHFGFLGAKSGFHPLVITAWGTDILIEPQQSFMKSFQVKYALKRADLATCDGENTASKLVELGVPKDRVQRIYFGVDTQRASPDRRDRKVFQKYLRDDNTKVVINIRGFSPVYDPDTFINAVPDVLKAHPNTVFIMARESEERKKYEEMVRKMGIQDAVAFIGNIPSNDIPSYLASSDIYVSTSTSDSGIAASTAEAMACGVPVISTDVADIRIWVLDGKNGYVIPKGDGHALSSKINALLSDPAAWRLMGQEARRTIVERQDYRTEMAKMGSIYMRLVEEGTK